MKIAFISQPWNYVIPPVRAGSIAIWNYQVACRLAEAHDVIIYARRIRTQKKKEKYLDVEYRRFWIAPDIWGNRILKRVVHSKGRRPFFCSVLYYFFYILRIALDMRLSSIPPDIVHVNNLSQFVPVIRKLLPRAKIILHMQCEWLTQLDETLIASRLRHADLILACSEHVINRVCQVFPQFRDLCHVIYNAVDEEVFYREPDYEKDDEIVRILFVGRISPEKGVHVLIGAFQKAVAQFPHAKLLIVGPDAATPHDYLVGLGDEAMVRQLRRFYRRDKSYPQILREMISPEMLSQISFVGPIPHDQMVSLYRGADILINPSLSEAFGMSLVEAMACELPVIASCIGGMKEIVVDNQSGMFFEPDDEEALVEAILRLAKDGRLRQSMGASGKQRVLEKFTWQKISDTLLRYYTSLFTG